MINYLRNDRLKIPVFDSKAEFNLYIQELEYWGLTDDIYPTH